MRYHDAPQNRFSFKMTVGATDDGGLRALVPVSVTVKCLPLNCPSSVMLQVPEDMPVGNIIGQIPAVRDEYKRSQYLTTIFNWDNIQ